MYFLTLTVAVLHLFLCRVYFPTVKDPKHVDKKPFFIYQVRLISGWSKEKGYDFLSYYKEQRKS
jgi:hypothetical protein